MGKIDGFLYNLINYDKENIHPDIVKEILKYLANPEFDPEFVISKSSAAAGLLVITNYECKKNFCKYKWYFNRIYNFLLNGILCR